METHNKTGRIPARLMRSLILSVTASTVGTFWVACALGVPLTMLMVRLGASGFQIGLLAAVMQFSVLAQLPAGVLLEKILVRRHYWAGIAGFHRVLWLTPAILPFLPVSGSARIWTLIAAVAVSSTAGNGASVLWFSWMADLVPNEVSGRFWGARQSVVMVAFVLGALFSGRVLDVYSGGGAGGSMTGFVIVFGLAAVMGLADVVTHWFVEEPVASDGSEPQRPAEQARLAWRDRDFRCFTLSMGFWMFAMGLTGSFGLVYMREIFGASYSSLAALSVAASLGALCAGIPMGILIDRIGARTVASLIMIAGPATGSLAWLFMSPEQAAATVSVVGFEMPGWLKVLLPFHFLLGGLFSGVGLSQIQLANAIAPRFGRLVPLATHWSISGVMSALGPICAGLLMDAVKLSPISGTTPGGMPLSYFHVLVIAQAVLTASVAAPLLLRVKERGAGLPRNMVMALLRVGNPLRLITFLHNVSIVKLMPREESRR